ncbi:MAG TPA: hypothetical protein VFH88_13810 [Candidatus Krumholzibacteria bacterium]|nr:hypothetical protein [Candidatus Krumholzibacteria bacterium]
MPTLPPAFLSTVLILIPIVFSAVVWAVDPPLQGIFATPGSMTPFRIFAAVAALVSLPYPYVFAPLFLKATPKKSVTVETIHHVGAGIAAGPFAFGFMIYVTGGTRAEMYAGAALSAAAQAVWWIFWTRRRA